MEGFSDSCAVQEVTMKIAIRVKLTGRVRHHNRNMSGILYYNEQAIDFRRRFHIGHVIQSKFSTPYSTIFLIKGFDQYLYFTKFI